MPANGAPVHVLVNGYVYLALLADKISDCQIRVLIAQVSLMDEFFPGAAGQAGKLWIHTADACLCHMATPGLLLFNLRETGYGCKQGEDARQ